MDLATRRNLPEIIIHDGHCFRPFRKSKNKPPEAYRCHSDNCHMMLLYSVNGIQLLSQKGNTECTHNDEPPYGYYFRPHASCKWNQEGEVIGGHFLNINGDEGNQMSFLNGRIVVVPSPIRKVTRDKSEENMDLQPQPGPSTEWRPVPTSKRPSKDEALKPAFDPEGKMWREEAAKFANRNRAWKERERQMQDDFARLKAMKMMPDVEAYRKFEKERKLFEADRIKFQEEKFRFEAKCAEAAMRGGQNTSQNTIPKQLLDHPKADRLLSHLDLNIPSVALIQPLAMMPDSASLQNFQPAAQDRQPPSASLRPPATGGINVSPESKSTGPKRLKIGSKARSPTVIDTTPLFEKNTSLGTYYSSGKKEEMERLDTSSTTNEELRHTLHLNNVPTPLSAPRLLLIATLWTLLETAGLALEAVMQQLCQVCWAPSALRYACGHAGLCISCGGGDKAGTCQQCVARDSDEAEQGVTDEYKAGEPILQLSNDRYIVVQQRFLTYTEEEAVLLSRKQFSKIPLDRVLILFFLNGLFKDWHIDDTEHAQSLLRCHFLACTEVKCRLCGIRSRIKPRGCPHDSWCRECIGKNKDRCLMCGIDVEEQGFSRMEHSVVPTANLE